MNALNTGLILLLSSILLTGCGVEMRTSSPAVDANRTENAASETTSNTPTNSKQAADDLDLPKQWQDAPYTLRVRLAGNGENEEMKVLGSAAIMQLDRRFYKVYVADFEFDAERSIMSQSSSIPAGKTLIQIGIQTDYGTNTPKIEDWTPLKVGDVAIDISDSRKKIGKAKPNGEPISTVGIFNSEGPTSHSVNKTLTAEVLHVSDKAICLKLDVKSEAGIQVSGVVSARVRDR